MRPTCETSFLLGPTPQRSSPQQTAPGQQGMAPPPSTQHVQRTLRFRGFFSCLKTRFNWGERLSGTLAGCTPGEFRYGLRAVSRSDGGDPSSLEGRRQNRETGFARLTASALRPADPLTLWRACFGLLQELWVGVHPALLGCGGVSEL